MLSPACNFKAQCECQKGHQNKTSALNNAGTEALRKLTEGRLSHTGLCHMMDKAQPKMA